MTPTVIHIHLDADNVSPDDVAAIIATAPPGAHFMIHGDWEVAPVTHATNSMAELVTHYERVVRSNHKVDFKKQYLEALLNAEASTPKLKPEPISYGPQRHNRKGKAKRW